MNRAKRVLVSCDVFRRVQDTERHMTPATSEGAILSTVCGILMLYLFVQETRLYFTLDTVSSMKLSEDQIGVAIKANINATFPYMPCFAVSLDVLDIMGRHEVGVSKDLKMTRLNRETGEPLGLFDDKSFNPHFGSSQAHEGCNVAGYFMVNKVPGNFHFSAHGTYDRVMAHLGGQVCVKHVLHSMYFGDVPPNVLISETGRQDMLANTAGESNFIDHDCRETYQYFIQIVPTTYHGGQTSYQYTNHVHSLETPWGHMPAIYFRYQMSGIAVKYTQRSMTLVRYLCNMCAVVGGVFTVFRMSGSLMHTGSYVIKKTRGNK